MDLLMVGNYVRRVACMPMNEASSRSHCVFTITLELRDYENNSTRTSKIHLVDLAGSERTYKNTTNHERTTSTEAKYINKSLSYLE